MSHIVTFRNHLRPAIRLVKCSLLSIGALLQHDNAWPHTVNMTRHDQGHLSVSLILWTCLTSLLVSSGPQISDLTKYKRQCLSDYACSPKHFSQVIQAIVKHWRTCTGHMWNKVKNDKAVLKPFPLNYPIKNFLWFGFTHLCIINTWNYYIISVWQC